VAATETTPESVPKLVPDAHDGNLKLPMRVCQHAVAEHPPGATAS
jgi:hypothetical protein